MENTSRAWEMRVRQKREFKDGKLVPFSEMIPCVRVLFPLARTDHRLGLLAESKNAYFGKIREQRHPPHEYETPIRKIV